MAVKRKRDVKNGDEDSSLISNKSEPSNIDTPFPRGGGSDLPPLEIKKAGVDATRDVYEQIVVGESGRKSQKPKRKTRPTGQPERKPAGPRVESLTLAKLRVGTQILGQISEIKASRLTISLPDNLNGFVDFEHDANVADQTALYTLGTWLRCTVIGLGEAPAKRVQLSISPELTNQTIAEDDYMIGMLLQGQVQSIEDHGAILSFGAESIFSGFLPTKNQLSSVKEGQILLTSVVKLKNKVAVLATSSSTALETIHEQASLVPGALVNVKISEILSNGVMCTIFGHIDVGADIFHSGLFSSACPKVDQTLRARILYNHPSDSIGETDRKIGVTLLSNALEFSIPKDRNAFTIGQIIETAKITNVTKVGAFIDIGLDKPAFSHISQLADGHIEDIQTDSRFKVNTIHKARVTGYCLNDDLYILSLQTKVLSQRYIHLDQIEAGAVITNARVDRILPKGGIVFRLDENITGIASEYQLSDIKLTNPEAKFKPGQKAAVRVLSVDKEAHKIKCSAKKTIVNWEGIIVESFESARPGAKTIATVVAFKERGAVVEFFGNIKGFLPTSEMSEALIEDPKTHFRVGQTLTVYVVECIPDSNRLIVSCRSSRSRAKTSDLTPLDIVTGEITEKTADAFVLDIDGSVAFLPFGQLADDTSSVKGEKKALSVGSQVGPLVVLDTSRLGFVVSKKNSLLDAVNSANLPAKITDLEVGKQYAGYVRSFSNGLGVFVAFANKLVGLLPVSEVTGREYNRDASISVFVTSINLKSQRFMLGLDKPKSTSGSENFEVGEVCEASIVNVKDTQLNVLVGSRQGRIEMTQIFDDISEIEDPRHPLKQFSKGQKIRAKILGYHDARSHKFLPLSHRSGTHAVLELCAKKSFVDADRPPLDLDSLQDGMSCLAFVNNVSTGGESLWANITPTVRARISRIDLTTDPDKAADIPKYFPIGCALSCTILEKRPSLVLTCLDKSKSTSLAMISKVHSTILIVRLPFFKTGFVAATDSSDNYEMLEKQFTTGEVLPARLIGENNGKLWVTLRRSIVTGNLENVVDREILNVDDISVGNVVRGYIKNISDGGIFVELGRDIVGRIQISQLSDSYLKDWKSGFKVGQVVKTKVLSTAKSRIELTLKQSVISGTSDIQPGIAEIKPGMKFEGSVRKVQPYGVFVSLDGTRLSGLCHKSEIADRDIENLNQVFTEGDRVKVIVLGVDVDKKQLSLGMKASYFNEDSDDEDEIEDADEIMEVESSNSDEEAQFHSESDENLTADDQISLDESAESDDELETADQTDAILEQETQGISAGFDWSGDILGQIAGSDESSNESDSDEDSAPRKRRRRTKFVADETAALHSRLPQSVQDFERLLVSNPNSSVLWMNFMAFQIQLSEIDAAREIAKRALKTISNREQDEKFNIWVALLNLENSFGTEESTNEAFREACRYMEPDQIHLRMAKIFAASEKLDKARDIFNVACKKFGSEELTLWLEFAKFLFNNKDATAARALLERAQKKLPKRLHRDLVLQFAKLEYEKGQDERGRTLFEGLLSAFPKKFDLWNVYIDQEIKNDAGNRKVLENLFERVFERNLSTKVAKQFFKKWLAYEVNHGDTKGADYVKAKAAEFVDKNT